MRLGEYGAGVARIRNRAIFEIPSVHPRGILRLSDADSVGVDSSPQLSGPGPSACTTHDPFAPLLNVPGRATENRRKYPSGLGNTAASAACITGLAGLSGLVGRSLCGGFGANVRAELGDVSNDFPILPLRPQGLYQYSVK